ncbi:MAG: ligand-binding sensor domain-containing protein, partial [Steroidobacteraceae bacterium]
MQEGKLTSWTQRDGLSGDLVRALAEDSRGRLWVGTNQSLDVIEAGHLVQPPPAVRALGAIAIQLLHEDHAGRLWIATEGNGLYVLDSGRLTQYGRADGLPNARVYAIHEDDDGTLWLGTSDGLARMRSGRFTPLARGSGPQQETILGILDDRAGSLWITANRGLFALNRASLAEFAAGLRAGPEFRAYGLPDGLRTSEFNGGNTGAGVRAVDGSFWLPTIRGFVRVDPGQIRTNPLRPPVLIEQVIVDGATFHANAPVRSRPGAMSWEFQYTALSLLAPGRVQFRYRLEGFDKSWVEAGTRRTAFYTGLPPGNYTFRGIASNDDGVWNQSGAAL